MLPLPLVWYPKYRITIPKKDNYNIIKIPFYISEQEDINNIDNNIDKDIKEELLLEIIYIIYYLDS